MFKVNNKNTRATLMMLSWMCYYELLTDFIPCSIFSGVGTGKCTLWMVVFTTFQWH